MLVKSRNIREKAERIVEFEKHIPNHEMSLK
jgi:hypothetical protein